MQDSTKPDRQATSTSFLARIKQAYRRKHRDHRKSRDSVHDGRSSRTTLFEHHDGDDVDETATHKIARWTMKAGEKAFDLIPDTVTNAVTPKGMRDERALMVIGDCVDAFPELAHHVSEQQWVEIASLGDDLYWQVQLSFALAFGVAVWNICFDPFDDGPGDGSAPGDTSAGTGGREHPRFGR